MEPPVRGQGVMGRFVMLVGTPAPGRGAKLSVSLEHRLSRMGDQMGGTDMG